MSSAPAKVICCGFKGLLSSYIFCFWKLMLSCLEKSATAWIFTLLGSSEGSKLFNRWSFSVVSKTASELPFYFSLLRSVFFLFESYTLLSCRPLCCKNDSIAFDYATRSWGTVGKSLAPNCFVPTSCESDSSPRLVWLTSSSMQASLVVIRFAKRRPSYGVPRFLN